MNWRRSLWNGGGAYLQQQDELGEALDGLHHEAVERDAVHTGGLLLLHSGGRGGGQVTLRRGGGSGQLFEAKQEVILALVSSLHLMSRTSVDYVRVCLRVRNFNGV